MLVDILPGAFMFLIFNDVTYKTETHHTLPSKTWTSTAENCHFRCVELLSYGITMK
jgi:hypothetical protein